MNNEQKKQEKKDQLNKNAKEYIPSKNRIPEKLEFNLNAKEYKPKEKVEVNNNDEEEIQTKMDMIVKDMAEDAVMEELGNEDFDDDENKFIQKYKDCQCCHGYVYKCKGKTCSSLGQCYCKMSDDCEPE